MIYPTDLTAAADRRLPMASYQTFAARQNLAAQTKTVRQSDHQWHSLRGGGISWRMMPHDLPHWRLVYYYFRQWASQGLVQQIHDQLVTKVRLQAGREASPSLGLVDSQSVKTMSVTTLKGYDGNKHRTGRKRFILVAVLGLVVALHFTSANVGERAGALLLFAKLGQRFTRLTTILADQGFDGVNFLATLKATYQLSVEVVCGVLGVKGFQVLPKPHRRTGWIVERTFGWWAFHRRLAKDYEVKESHAEAVIYWTMIRLMSRKIRETQS